MPRTGEMEARRPHPIVSRRACQDSFREHRDDSAQTRDVVCGVRSTYGVGVSATEGDVWGACWGKGLRRGAREGLVGASEGGYVGLWNEIHASECDNNNLYARRRASGLV